MTLAPTAPTDSRAATTAGAARALPLRAWRSTRRFRPVLALDVLMLIAFALYEPVFLTRANVFNLLTSISIVWLVAMGMTFVLVSGGFDLSAGAVATISGIAAAKLLGTGVPGGVAIVLAVLVGAAIGGLLNGVLIGRLGLSVFVVTLATTTSLTGFANLWTDTQTLPVTSGAVTTLVVDRTLGLPNLVWLMALTFLLALYLQTSTHFGRDVFAVGGSQVAARLSGIRTVRVIVGVYLLLGGCAGLAGVIAAGRIGGAAPQVDSSLPLQAIAGVLLGGTSLVGGLGGVGGTALGVLFIGLLSNGLSLSGVPSFYQQVITGVILVGAVLGDRFHPVESLARRRAASTPPATAPPDGRPR